MQSFARSVFPAFWSIMEKSLKEDIASDVLWEDNFGGTNLFWSYFSTFSSSDTGFPLLSLCGYKGFKCIA